MAITILNLLFNVLYILIIARVILSWVRVSPYHPTWGPLVRFVYETTEPMLAPIRNLMPQMGGLDLSPIILLLGIQLLSQLLIGLLI